MEMKPYPKGYGNLNPKPKPYKRFKGKYEPFYKPPIKWKTITLRDMVSNWQCSQSNKFKDACTLMFIVVNGILYSNVFKTWAPFQWGNG